MALKDNPLSIERMVAEKLVTDALKTEYAVTVRDGEEFTLRRSKEKNAILEAMCTTDPRVEGLLKGAEKLANTLSK